MNTIRKILGLYLLSIIVTSVTTARPVFTVVGKVEPIEGYTLTGDLSVVVTNTVREVTANAAVSQHEANLYTATLIALDGKKIIDKEDLISVVVQYTSGQQLAEETFSVVEADISFGRLIADVTIVDIQSVSVTVDGEKTLTSEKHGIYQASYVTQEGDIAVDAIVAFTLANRKERTQRLTIGKAPGQTLIFTLEGSPKQKATVTVGGVTGITELEMAELSTKEVPLPLTGDVNTDGEVNIFDLVTAAGQFGKTGKDLAGDVNSDGAVNIFDLVMVASNFGKSVAIAAAPSMISKIQLATDQKHHIAAAIDQLESSSNRSSEEEIALNILKALLPERLPTRTQLLANYPNPFNPETWIPFQLAEDSAVTAKIYDLTGKQVRVIELGHLSAGSYVESSRAIYWDGKTETGEQVSSGTYFYQIQAGDYTATKKMGILK